MRGDWVVVDASVLFAALLRDGRTREAVWGAEHVLLCAPTFAFEEVLALAPQFQRLSGLGSDIFTAALEVLRTRVVEVSADGYRVWRPQAQALARAAGAWGDDEYIALALSLDAPIWTYDKDFQRIGGIRLVTTKELLRE